MKNGWNIEKSKERDQANLKIDSCLETKAMGKMKNEVSIDDKAGDSGQT